MTVSERAAAGKAARSGARRSSHGEWEVAPERADPLEVLEAQAMHSKRRDEPEIQEFRKAGQPLLEAQVVDAADSLAYDTHDIDDALGVGRADAAGPSAAGLRCRLRHEAKRGHRLASGELDVEPEVVAGFQ